MQKVLIGLFLLMLCAPTVQQVFHIVQLEPVVESRQKVPLPPGNAVAELWRAQGYFSEYEKHFNDVFGFRDFFIRLRNQIQYSLFRDSDQVIVGRNGWLVDKDSVNIEEHTGDTLTDAQWKRLGQRLVHLDAILRARGITFLIIPVPFKNTVYPENYPEQTAKRPATTGYERFRNLLATDHLPYVDVYDVLEKNRAQGMYYRTDIHWNLLAARLVADRAVRQLAQATHRDVRWRYPLTVGTKPLVGGAENDVLAVFWPPVDVEPAAYEPSDECGATTLGTAIKDTVFINHCRGTLLPPAMLFGNSYMLQMAAVGFQDHFSRVTRVYDIQHFGDVLSKIQPGTKILIWQNFELEIGYQMQQDEFWKEVDAYKGR